MTIAQQFIADTKGKSVKEISDIEQEYYKKGLFNGDDGLHDYLLVEIGPKSISNGTLTIDLWDKPVFDMISYDEWDYLQDKVTDYMKHNSPLTFTYDPEEFEANIYTFTAYADYADDMDGEYGDFDIPISAHIAQEIIDKVTPTTRTDDDEGWIMTFTWDATSTLDDSYWRFDDGSTCDWDDLTGRW